MRKTGRVQAQNVNPIAPDDEWPPVIIEWVDAMSEWGDFRLKEITSELPLRRSIGFLVYADETEVRIVGTDDRKNTMGIEGGDMLRVPTVLIKPPIVFLKDEAEKCPRTKRSRSAKKTLTKRSRRT